MMLPTQRGAGSWNVPSLASSSEMTGWGVGGWEMGGEGLGGWGVGAGSWSVPSVASSSEITVLEVGGGNGRWGLKGGDGGRGLECAQAWPHPQQSRSEE